MTAITQRLMRELRSQFRLDWRGVHGAPHWARVRHHGLMLARALGTDARVAELFAVLHDSQRQDEWEDEGHGDRAADYAGWLCQRGYFDLDSAALAALQYACRGHSDGQTVALASVQVCWDADRLDLGRVGMRPDPRRLCTATAQRADVIERAWFWSIGDSYRSSPAHCLPPRQPQCQ